MSAIFNEQERKEAIATLAASWASIDGKLEKFGAEAKLTSPDDFFESSGTHMGYMVEAEEMLARLEKRGFTLARLVSPVRVVR